MIIVAGLSPAATEDAARILADAGALSPLLKHLPANWEKRNLELVVRVAGTRPELVDQQVW